MKETVLFNRSSVLFCLAFSILAIPSLAATAVDEEDDLESSTIESVKRDDIYITGGADAIKKAPGSAHLVDEQALEKFEYDDINRVLAQIPGVNVQEEDGYGLRPNIGLRGAHPHRSRKIALMEDAVLIGPAPYSAPAAYYFPMFAKMEGIEVFKGPVSIKHGPNTVGGAVNMVTRSIPVEDGGRMNVSVGSDQYIKSHIYYGQRADQWGWLVDGLNIQTDGFKDLDTGGDTGFNKSDITFKGMINSDINADVYQQLELKLQYSDENSDATYVGLSEEDFAENPYRRYAASDRDNMDAEHSQIMLTHYIELTPTFALTSILYHNEFDREWSKLNGFESPTDSLTAILANPNGANQGFMDVLRGELNSVDLGRGGALVIGNNARSYGSQGVQFLANWQPMTGAIAHDIDMGIRFHHDYIERNHTVDSFLMTDGVLVSDGGPRVAGTTNKDYTDALALHIQDKIELGDLTLTGGTRIEFIDSVRKGRSGAGAADKKNSDEVVIPGLGAFYQVTEELGLLAGVYKGFSPVGPGQDDFIKPEESVNYEYGFRFYRGALSAELVGFFNDYSNIKGVCTFASGCDDDDVDKEFNGGAALINGAELSLGYTWKLGAWNVPTKLDYTYTNARFASTFQSENPDWGVGLISKGDILPYIPEHQANASIGLVDAVWSIHAIAKYVGERSDTANTTVTPSDRKIDAYTVFDAKVGYQVHKAMKVHASVKNVFDKVYVTSRRPYGDRPGIERQVQLGFKYRF